MKRTLLIFIALLVSSIQFSYGQLSPENKTGIHPQSDDYLNPSRFGQLNITKSVKFARVINYKGANQDLLCDIYEPAGDSSLNRPCILWIHGGGFRTGSSRNQNYIATYAGDFAKRGYVCISIDYRLRDGADMPSRAEEFPALQDAARDAYTALEWIRKNASCYRIDTERLFVAGGSAGGRTAATLAYFDGIDSLSAAGGCSPRWNKSGLMAAAILWGAPEPEFRNWSYPFLCASSIPAILIHGEADKTIPAQNSLDLSAQMQKAGIEHSLFLIPGAGHTPTAYDAEIESRVATFFSGQMKQHDRKIWIDALQKIAGPVLTNLSKNTLRANMPVENESGNRYKVSHLEAFGRVMCGIAPWIELGPDSTSEGAVRGKYLQLSLQCLKNAVDPASPDKLNFNGNERQPLVDAAFLAEALLRAPRQLWGNLDKTTRNRLISAFKSTRTIKPGENNWLLFSAMIESALLEFTGECKKEVITYALNQFASWYKGDGWYGDGKELHSDYYNSIVIHPLMMDILKVLTDKNMVDKEYANREKTRWARFAATQERLIAPDGTYPVIGRSVAYRFGIFHCLAQASLLHGLPDGTTPAQVRCALTKVIANQITAAGTFDGNGWLQIGVYGHQPGVGETYISTGSLYMCSVVFLPLGLKDTDEFWSAPPARWTGLKIWSGENIKADHAIHE
jgi:pimeloyl-ACP methyl ester carboxylesterase